MDAGEKATNAILRRTEAQIDEIYGAALQQAVKSHASFFQKIAAIDSGKIKPPAVYDTPEKVLKWRQGYTKELLRREKIVDGIIAELRQAGVDVAPIIKSAGVDNYMVNRSYTAAKLTREFNKIKQSPIDIGQSKINLTFAQYDKRQIEILLQDTQSPFSKIAYKNLGANAVITRRLRSEMAQATLLGESQSKIIKRIRAVTGQSQYQARRVAQTERTRLQSQARSDTLQEAADLGVKVTKTWSARMVNTRDTHAALDGVTIPQDEAFHLIDGDSLMYPGDPNGRAENVISCHCVLIPGVAT